jgi:hypothetical protein
MPKMLRLLTGLISTLPALLIGLCVFTCFRGEYYWLSYLITAGIFSLSSFVWGYWLPGFLIKGRFNNPWLWVFTAGGLAWMLAISTLGLLNLTPLCIGQDNGDGINDAGLCFLYTALAGLVYTPGMLVLLLANSFIGGKILGRWITSSNNPDPHSQGSALR